MTVPCELQVGQLSVRGLSLAGVETCLQVPQLDLCFDVGHCPRSFLHVRHLFISHAHADHAAGFVGLLALRLLHSVQEPLEVYGPAVLLDALRVAATAYERAQGHPYHWRAHPLSPGDEVALDSRRVVKAFAVTHVIETFGFTVYEDFAKLKAIYKDLPGPEIARLKRQGVAITDTVRRPMLSFSGDTTIEALEREPDLLASRVLLLESTYLDARKTVGQCREHGHVHLDEILERADGFQNEHLVLTHFSQCYSPPEVRRIVAERAEGRLRPALHVFAPPGEHWPG